MHEATVARCWEERDLAQGTCVQGPNANPYAHRAWVPVGECHPTHRYPGVLQSLRCRDAFGWVDGQHLVDKIFRFGSDGVPLRGGELPTEGWVRDGREQGKEQQSSAIGLVLLQPQVAAGRGTHGSKWELLPVGEQGWREDKTQDDTHLFCKVDCKVPMCALGHGISVSPLQPEQGKGTHSLLTHPSHSSGAADCSEGAAGGKGGSGGGRKTNALTS